jgi:hypothetical protein
MNDTEIRATLTRYWTDVQNQAIVDELYHEDAILEFPQSGERMVGLANIRAMRAVYPADVTLTLQRISGDGAYWVGEHLVSYNGGPPMFGACMVEIRDGRIRRETIYFGEPFAAPDWRKQWVER